MSLISDDDGKEIRSMLAAMEHPVRLVHFTQTLDCDTCPDTRILLEELATMSDKLSLETFNLALDRERAAAYRIDKVPATVVEGDRDYGIRFYGAPAGYEFASLLDAILMVSHRDSELTPESRAMLASVSEPMHLEVLVTPTCPYCPRAVRSAFQMALENPNITADAVEISEYPDLARRYRVMGVPKTMIDGREGIEGALPETAFVSAIVLQGLGNDGGGHAAE